MTVNEMIARKKEYGFSYEYISKKSGVPVSTIQKVFSRTTSTPRWETIEALNKAFIGCESKNCCLDGEIKSFSEHNAVREGEAEYNAVSGANALPLYSENNKTIDDYLKLPEGTRVELIDGVFYDMAAPIPLHQRIASLINTVFELYIRANKGNCVPFIAPTDVQLDCDDKTVVQPDVFILCDRNKITKKRIFGVPDLIVEVLSESNWYNDIFRKYNKYRKAGVREYWIVIPENFKVLVYDFEKNTSEGPKEYTFEDKVPVSIWDGKCEVDFKEIYEDIKFLL
ncbi:MAG: Uma2 family endonuclease [Lachnospiraceae bacterium]|nr:Uma2 family endonuclease [Lachnospiraceae bacterium]